MKKAHIVSRPEHSIGDQVIGLCGKEFTVTVLWDDVPRKKRTCRDCVDTALAALTEADALIETVRLVNSRLTVISGLFSEALDVDLELDKLADLDEAFQDELAATVRELAEAERIASTCTCKWTAPEFRTPDPQCPIHGDEAIEGELDAIGVEVPEISEDEQAEITETLYDIALRVTDEQLGEGTYAEMNKDNPDPNVQAAIDRSKSEED